MCNKIEVTEGPNGKRIFLGKNFPGIYFTEREAEMAQLLADYKYYEIGELLDISKRTAEYYSMNMKKKLHCENKRELVYVLKHSGLIEQLANVVDISHLFKNRKFDDDQADQNNDEKTEALALAVMDDDDDEE